MLFCIAMSQLLFKTFRARCNDERLAWALFPDLICKPADEVRQFQRPCQRD
jgi:hypothetical protein